MRRFAMAVSRLGVVFGAILATTLASAMSVPLTASAETPPPWDCGFLAIRNGTGNATAPAQDAVNAVFPDPTLHDALPVEEDHWNAAFYAAEVVAPGMHSNSEVKCWLQPSATYNQAAAIAGAEVRCLGVASQAWECAELNAPTTFSYTDDERLSLCGYGKWTDLSVPANRTEVFCLSEEEVMECLEASELSTVLVSRTLGCLTPPVGELLDDNVNGTMGPWLGNFLDDILDGYLGDYLKTAVDPSWFRELRRYLSELGLMTCDHELQTCVWSR